MIIRSTTILAIMATLGACSGQTSSEATSTDAFEQPLAAGPELVVPPNKTWHCTRRQDDTKVRVTIDSPSASIDAIHLDEGCSGRLTVHVNTNSADGIKVHDGVHDLVVTGSVSCTAKSGAVHQDGVQAMGGERVQFGDGANAGSFKVDCPTGNNGALFINEGRGGRSTPTDIVCDHCDLFEGNAALHIGAGSVRSGARNSVLHHGTSNSSPRDCRRIEPGATAPIDVNNTCI